MTLGIPEEVRHLPLMPLDISIVDDFIEIQSTKNILEILKIHLTEQIIEISNLVKEKINNNPEIDFSESVNNMRIILIGFIEELNNIIIQI